MLSGKAGAAQYHVGKNELVVLARSKSRWPVGSTARRASGHGNEGADLVGNAADQQAIEDRAAVMVGLEKLAHRGSVSVGDIVNPSNGLPPGVWLHVHVRIGVFWRKDTGGIVAACIEDKDEFQSTSVKRVGPCQLAW